MSYNGPFYMARRMSWCSATASKRRFIRTFSVSALHNQQIATVPKEIPNTTILSNVTYNTDEHTNVPASLLPKVTRKLHIHSNHPVSNIRKAIQSLVPSSSYEFYTDLHPVVSVAQNFDVLGFPADHPGRNRTDTYYVNKHQVLRTHTSAHQVEKFKTCPKPGYLISADVYRRDEIDRSHYPVFHQMEGAYLFTRTPGIPDSALSSITHELSQMPPLPADVHVTDCNAYNESNNPVQLSMGHTPAEALAVGNHLKRTLETIFSNLFIPARAAARAAGLPVEETTQMRWVEAYFPFTSPSYELEILWQGQWMEMLGCGVVNQHVLNYAGQEDKIGWAFGIGLERLAMLIYGIPDIRLFWSEDVRFLGQFSEDKVERFVPFSMYPACYKDVAFWIPSGGGVSAAGGGGSVGSQFHENDFMEIVRGVGGDLVEDVKLIDEFTHPKTNKKSVCYRINYRALDRTLKNEEIDELQEKVRNEIKDKLGVELR